MGKVLKKVISVVLLSSMVLSIASCSGGVKSKTSDQFKKAILDAKVGLLLFSCQSLASQSPKCIRSLHFSVSFLLKTCPTSKH